MKNTFKEYGFAFSALLLITAVFYSSILFTNRYGFQYDIKDIHYPWQYFNAQSLKSGELPLWNPYYSGGEPQLASIQTAALYPINVVFYFLSKGPGVSYKNIEVNCIFHFFIGSFFFYVFLKKYFQLSIYSSLYGAITFLLSGFYVAHAQHFSTIQSVAWIPLILTLYFNSIRPNQPLISKNNLILSVILLIQFLAGQTQIFYYTMLFIGFVSLASILSSIRLNVRQSMMSLNRYVLPLVLVSTLCLMMAAFQLLPTFEYINHNVRSRFGYSDTLSSSLQIKNLLSLTVPFWTGGHNFSKMWVEIDFTESHYYMGSLLIILIIYGLVTIKTNIVVRRPFFLVAILFFLLSLGDLTPLHKIFYYIIPFYSKLRRTVNLLWFVNIGLLSFMAIVLEDVLCAKDNQRMRNYVDLGKATFLSFLIFAGIFCYFRIAESALPAYRIINRQILIAITFVGTYSILLFIHMSANERKYKHIVKTLLLLVVLADLFYINFRQPFNIAAFNINTYLNNDYIQDSPPKLLRHLGIKNGDTDFRVMIFPYSWRGLVYTHAPSVLQFQNTLGYYSMYLNSYSKYVDVLFSDEQFILKLFSSYSSATVPSINRNLLSLLNVKYLVVGKDTYLNNEKIFRQIASSESGEDEYYEAEIYSQYKIVKVADYLPKVFISSDYSVQSDLNLALKKIAGSDYLPGRQIVVNRDPGFKPENYYQYDDINVTDFRRNSISVRTHARNSGVLSLSEIMYPGWKVFVDDKEQPIITTNGIFRGVAIEKGDHDVVFKFRPRSFVIGMVVSFFGLVLTIVLFVTSGSRLLSSKPR